MMSEPTLLSGAYDNQPVDANTLPNKRVLLFLTSGFEDAEAACALDVLGWTRYRPSVATVDVTVAAFREEVRGAFGTTMKADVLIGQVDATRFDALVVPGGFHNLGFDEAYDERLRELARAFRSLGRPIATMCVGIVPVAEAGVLEDGVATTYPFSSRRDNQGRLRELGCVVSEDPVVDWNGIISCSGPAFSEQVMRLLLERLVGSEAAAEVERYRRGC